MQICEKENEVIVEAVQDFHLEHIFECGQCFRWEKQPDGSYTGIAFGRALNVKFIPGEENGFSGKLILTGASGDDFNRRWKPYFDLDRDYGELKARLSADDPVMEKAILSGQGIRILRQDIWETIISFIISQNNNIPRIKKCIESLCTSFGKPVNCPDGVLRYAFPGPDTLSPLSLADLAECRLGYRAKYIIESAKMADEGGADFLGEMRILARDETERRLLGFCGVGPKVANCIMLFSMDKYDSFPIDVWVKRLMNRLYGIEEKNTKEMLRYAKERFGEYSGFAQQYLFYYIRQLDQEA